MDIEEPSEHNRPTASINEKIDNMVESSNNNKGKQPFLELGTSDMDIDINKKRMADTQISRGYDGSEES
ncbi:unnamed protein product [Rhizophagus irregularis]|nr:unnamed protein product [Rhizophagus irregularis]CAB4472935.1 unnamed protein product [Rhizophagus irregularis]